MGRRRKRMDDETYMKLCRKVQAGSRPAARELLPMAVRREDGAMAVLCVDVLFGRSLLLVNVDQRVPMQQAQAIAQAAKRWASGEDKVLTAWAGTFTVQHIQCPREGVVQLKPAFRLVPEGAAAVITPGENGKPPAVTDLPDDVKEAIEAELEREAAKAAGAETVGEPEQVTPPPPFDGYDDREEWRIIAFMHEHQTEELRAIVKYETANKARPGILAAARAELGEE